MNIKGAGTLTVKGKFRNGIQCSNDLKIKNGNITVEAEENAIKGKGSVQISGGTLNLTAKKGDALESDECEEGTDGKCKKIVEGKGIVDIRGGNITIKAGDDGVQAANFVVIRSLRKCKCGGYRCGRNGTPSGHNSTCARRERLQEV